MTSAAEAIVLAVYMPARPKVLRQLDFSRQKQGRARRKEKRTTTSATLLPARPLDRLQPNLLGLCRLAHLDVLAVGLESGNDVEDGLVRAGTGLHRTTVDYQEGLGASVGQEGAGGSEGQ